MNLFAAFQARFPKDRAAPFIMERARTYTYGDLEQETARVP
mgnify:CR=1 FL=1